MALVAATLAGTTAAAAYLDAQFRIRKDLAYLYRMHSATQQYAKAVRQNRASNYYLFEQSALTYPTTTCLWSRSGIYTWHETSSLVNQYASYFLSLGVRPGDLVALYLQNVPEYMFAWLGLLAIGCAPAMINWNLGGEALVHCMRVAGAKVMVVDAEEGCRGRVEGVRERIEGEMGVRVVVLTEGVKAEIAGTPAERLGDEYREGVTGESPVCLFYTSGTTGLPKAVRFTTQRNYIGVTLDSTILPPRYDSYPGPHGATWYNSMPLYHGTGGITTLGLFLTGVTTALGLRFRTQTFWPDIHASSSTHFTYVGETARYLLAAPPSPLDTTHRVHCIFGNGMRPDVWTRFQTRFAIPCIAEFFASTEGLFATLNHSRNPHSAHAVGHHGLLLRLLTHNTYVPVATDPVSGAIARDPTTGFATRLPYARGGEILVAVPSPAAFPGYYNAPEATARKFARDVFRTGDLYYRTGDALRRDHLGRWFFLDRLGDTYRWKSENVSTAEVAAALGAFPGIVEANVYGVEVPGHEGRAGCAAVVVEAGVEVDWVAVARFVRERLPGYAVPVFYQME
ncbi:AMP-dependent synthetase/ligase [Lasallia pustulata]|uniref:Very long-chain fatty acid transport protein n=1 Tax=Lasallia pustulata TaxID=136370 RepID=A0A1W5DC09_9LECA|nr:AMP-dependent synthetase/ligase [Lasallia pustulata]